MLPDRILICAGGDKYILFTTSYVNRIYEGNPVTCVKLTPLRPVQGLLSGSPSSAERVLETFIERDSSRHGAKIYPCSIGRTNVHTEGRIYVYTITRPLIVLHSLYYQVYKGLDKQMKWHVRFNYQMPESRPLVIPEIETPEIQTPEIQAPEIQTPEIRIPSHVLKGYIDGLIATKQTCPITMEEFCLGNITVTGCGHAFEKGSLDSVSVCPLCRVNLVKEEFVSL